MNVSLADRRSFYGKSFSDFLHDILALKVRGIFKELCFLKRRRFLGENML